MRKRWRRVLSFILSVSLAIGMTPMASFAAPGDPDEGPEQSEVSITEMALDTAYTAVLAEGEYWVGSFTAAADGLYEFFSEGNEDTYGYLYSDAKLENVISWDDQSGYGNNFKLQQNMDAGDTVYLKVTEYYGNEATFTVKAVKFNDKDLSNGDIWLNTSDYAITGEPIALNAEVYDYNGDPLTAGTDFEYVYVKGEEESTTAPSEEGSYDVYARAIGETYTGQTSKVSITLFDIYDLSKGYLFLNQNNYTMTGEPVVLDVTVSDHDYNALTEGTDYELVYLDKNKTEIASAPADAGYYYVYASAIGETYSGRTSMTSFTIINKKDLSNGYFSLNKSTYRITDGPVQIQCLVEDYDGNNLTEGTDYELEFLNENKDALDSAPEEPGYYYVYARAIGENYSGQTYSESFRLVDAYNIGEGNWYSYSMGTQNYDYTGEAVQVSVPDIYYYDNDISDYVYLTAGTDFKLDHYEDTNGNQLEAAPAAYGRYYAVYAGIAPYKGSYKAYFRIVGDGYDLSIARLNIAKTIDYTGNPINPNYTVYDVNDNYVYDDYYTLVYYDSEGELSEAPSAKGEYQVAARAKEDTSYKGETPKVSIKICGEFDLGNSRFYTDYWYGSSSISYTGEALTPPYATIVDNYNYEALVKGVDYEFSHVENEAGEDIGKTVTEIGTYYTVYEGIGNYTGSIKASFTVVDPYDLSNADVSSYNSNVPLVDGTAALPEITVTDRAGNTITEGVDYEFDHIDGLPDKTLPTKVGYYGAYYKGLGDYKGKFYISFSVYDPKDIDSWYYTYPEGRRIEVGSSALPKITIYRTIDGSDVVLVEGTDYELDYITDDNYNKIEDSVPQKPGEYYAYYKGKGDYTGTKSAYFYVYDPKDIENWELSYRSSVELGATSLPSPTIYRWVDDENKIVLTEGTDFELDHIQGGTVNYEKVVPQAVGGYTAYYKGIGEYSGTVSFYFSIYDPKNIENWNVEFKNSNSIELGSDKLPAISIYRYDNDDNRIVLSEGTDYELEKIMGGEVDYGKEIPQSIGYYYAYFKGIGDYSGSISVRFGIFDPKDIANWSISTTSSSSVDLGSTTLPTVSMYRSVDDEYIYLTENQDFVFDHIEDGNGENCGKDIPDAVGTYYMVFRGTGEYTGERSTYFYVVDPKDLRNWSAYFGDDWDTYSLELGTTSLPSPTIYRNGVTLTEGTDFEFVNIRGNDGVYYEDTFPNEIGWYEAFYKGVGEYTGTRSIEFMIFDPKDLANWRSTFTTDDVIELGAASIPTPKIYRYVDDVQVVLVEGTDYEFEYIEDDDGEECGKDVPKEAGYYYARYKGIGAYTGTRSIRFRVIDPKDIQNWSGEFSSYSLEIGTATLPSVEIYRYDADDRKVTLMEGTDYVFDHFTDDDGVECGTEIPKTVGYYYACYNGIGEYKGTNAVEFRIYDPKDIGNWSASFSPDDEIALGATTLPTPAIYRTVDGKKVTLVEGTDYTFDCIKTSNGPGSDVIETFDSVPDKVGGYQAYYKGIGEYTGTQSIYFQVYDPMDIGAYVDRGYYWDGSLSPSSIELGTTEFPTVRIYRSGKTLVEGTDYVFDHIEYESDGSIKSEKAVPQSPGSYYAYYKGIGEYTGTRSFYFKVYDPKDIGNWDGDLSPSMIELGATTLPIPRIYRWVDDNDTETLAEGKDYELDHIEINDRYDDRPFKDYGKSMPDEAGWYYACYKGIGDYTGTRTLSFRIYDPHDLTSIWNAYFATSSSIELGSTTLPTPMIYRRDDDDPYASIILTEGTDYELARILDQDGTNLGTDVPSEVGSYCAVYAGKAPYFGEKTLWFNVYRSNDLGNGRWTASFKNDTSEFETTGTAIQLPEILIQSRDGKVLLAEGKDYKLARYEKYDGETGDWKETDTLEESGEYYAVYQGMGDYVGELKKWFQIRNLLSLSDGRIQLAKNRVSATGKPVELSVTVKDADGVEIDASAYELVYTDEDGIVLSGGAPSAVGSYRIYAKAKEDGTYKGQTDSWYFYIIASDEPTAISAGTPVAVAVDDNEVKTFAFTASKDGSYVFYSEGDTDSYGRLYEDAEKTKLLAQDDDGGENMNFRIIQNLKAGQTVYLETSGCSYNSAAFTVCISADAEKDLASASFRTDYDNLINSGNLLIPVITIRDSAGNELKAGTHYKLAFAISRDDTYKAVDGITEPGRYRVVASAIEGSGYKNQIVGYITVRSSTELTYDWVETKDVMAGAAAGSAITVTNRDGKQLVEGTDYELQYYQTTDGISTKLTKAPTEEGSYFAVINAIGTTYTGGDLTAYFNIYPSYDLEEQGSIQLFGYSFTEYGEIPVYGFSGKPVTPEFTVKYHGKELAGTNYTVSYANNDVASANGKLASVTVTGKDPYKGSVTAYFILEAKLDLASLISTKGFELKVGDFGQRVYGGSNVIQFPVAKWKEGLALSIVDETGKKLVEGTDYEVSFADESGTKLAAAPTTAGKYQLIITAKEQSSYTGEVKVRFVLADIDESEYRNVLIDGAVVTLSNTSFTYDGTAKLPEVTSVVLDGTELTIGDDYYFIAVPSECVEIGTYSFTIGGEGRYTGSVVASFSIDPIDLSKATVTLGATSYTYDGKAKAPGVKSVVVNGKTLEAGTDYEVTAPTNCVERGTYTYTVTGIGHYTGTATASFTIAGKGASSISIADQTVYYTGSAIAYSGEVTKTGSTGKVTYTYYSDSAGKKKIAASKVVEMGTYYVKATLAADANYEGAESALAKFVISITKGWHKIGDKYYYYSGKGEKLTGWRTIGKKNYYLGEDGARRSGWQEIDGKWYFFSGAGVMKTGWKQSGSLWYYFGEDGAMYANKWLKSGGKWYYFKKDGTMAANEWCKGWWLNKNGTCTYGGKASWKKDSVGWYYIDTKGWYAKSTTMTIDGKKYSFNAAGYLK